MASLQQQVERVQQLQQQLRHLANAKYELEQELKVEQAQLQESCEVEGHQWGPDESDGDYHKPTWYHYCQRCWKWQRT